MIDEALATVADRQDAEVQQAVVLRALDNLTEQAERTWEIVCDWHDSGNWALLGYPSFDAWRDAHVPGSRATVYRMMDKAKTFRSLNAGSDEVERRRLTGASHADTNVAPTSQNGSLSPPLVSSEYTLAETKRLAEAEDSIVRSVAQGTPRQEAAQRALERAPKPTEVVPDAQLQLTLDFTPTLAERIDAAAAEAGYTRKEWVEGAILAALEQKQERFAVNPSARNVTPAPPGGLSSRGPHCPPGCKERTVHRFGRAVCVKHG